MNEEGLTTEHTEITEERKRLNCTTEAIIGAAIEVHRVLGPGLLESTYEMCLCRELSLRGMSFERQKPVPVNYKDVRLDCGYRADLVVASTVLLEIKSLESILPIHEAQLLSYLKLSRLPVGLLINFNVKLLKHGIRRRLLDQEPIPSSVISVPSVVKT
jgi:GxxExxY protein